MGICKRISAEKKSASAAARTRNLANYITTPELANGLEKCVWSGSKGFLSNTHEGRIAEMISLAGESKHSKDPLDHWMISLHDDEKFSREQAAQAVDIFLKHTGLLNHQVIWGVHDDTKNRHIHISVNRVNPETLLVAKINKGFNKEAGQQVIALIEHTQGWKHEKGARYTVIDGVPVMTAEAAKKKAGRMADEGREPKKPGQKALDMEVQTGTKSAQRVGSEDAAPVILQARTWRELHDNLAAVGMRYERKGSGAIIFIGDQPIKASDVSRSASLSALQKRFGPYQPAREINPNAYHHHRTIDRNHTTQQNLAAPGKEPANHLQIVSQLGVAILQEGGQARRARVLSLDARADRHGDFRLRRSAGRHGTDTAERTGHNQDGGNNADRANQGLRTSNARRAVGGNTRTRNGLPLKPNQPGWDEYQTIKAEHKAAKEGATTNLQVSQQAQRDALFEKQKAERSELFTRSWRGQGTLRNAMLSIIATRHAAEKLELREQQQAERAALREKHRPLPQYKQWKEQPQIVSEVEQIEVKPVQLQQPQLAALLRTLRQSPDLSGYFTYRSGDVALFRDEGKTIAVLDQSSQSIAAALAVAQSKYGQTLTLTGSHDFQVRAVRAGVEHGLTVKYKDSALEEMRLNLIEAKRQAERQAQAERAERAAAVAAERDERERAKPTTNQPAQPELSSVVEVPATVEVAVPALTCADWVAQQSKLRSQPRKSGDGVLEFVVAYAADYVVLDHGRTVALYSKPGFEVQPGQRLVIGKDGSLLPAPDRLDLDKNKGQEVPEGQGR